MIDFNPLFPVVLVLTAESQPFSVHNFSKKIQNHCFLPTCSNGFTMDPQAPCLVNPGSTSLAGGRATFGGLN
jgi:hypothetical protein